MDPGSMDPVHQNKTSNMQEFDGVEDKNHEVNLKLKNLDARTKIVAFATLLLVCYFAASLANGGGLLLNLLLCFTVIFGMYALIDKRNQLKWDNHIKQETEATQASLRETLDKFHTVTGEGVRLINEGVARICQKIKEKFQSLFGKPENVLLTQSMQLEEIENENL